MTSSGRWRGPTAPTTCQPVVLRMPSAPLRAALLAACLLAGSPGAAHADPFTGTTCGFSAMNDPTGDTSATGQFVGEIDGGPYAAADLASLTLTCALQLGTGAYADPDAVSATASGTGVVVLAPTPITFPAGYEPIYTCTELTVGAVTYYYDGPSDTYLTDRDAARCDLAAEV